MTASTIYRLSNTPGQAAATNTRDKAVVLNGLGGSATPSKAPPPPVGRSPRGHRPAPGAASPVTQEEGVTWFG